MNICHCNNCGNNYEDPNPDNKSIDYPDSTPTAGHLAQLFEELNNPESIYWGCPECCTDGFLVDNIPAESEQEIIMFHLEDDNECYYCFYESEMQNFAENEGKEIESWGIATNGMPDGALKLKEGENIYINYGIR